jgi:hypothetical protein
MAMAVGWTNNHRAAGANASGAMDATGAYDGFS